MYYVLNGDTITIDETYEEAFFERLKDDLSFPYEVSQTEKRKNVVMDLISEEKLIKPDLFQNLNLLQDYDVRNYIFSQLDTLISVTDVPDIICGTTNDIYTTNSISYTGDQLSFAELSYENEWSIISLESVAIDNIGCDITKNNMDKKTVYKLCDIPQLVLSKAINDEGFLNTYFSSYDKVVCAKDCMFGNWDSISKVDRKKVLTTFHKEVEHIVHNELEQLGHYPGKNSNRVEKINENIFEYRLANPNYRIYYSRINGKIVILLTMLKRRTRISTTLMNNLVRIKNYESINYA